MVCRKNTEMIAVVQDTQYILLIQNIHLKSNSLNSTLLNFAEFLQAKFSEVVITNFVCFH